MKKKLIMFSLLVLAVPLMAQETNVMSTAPAGDARISKGEDQQSPDDRRKEFEARQLKMMEKALKEIGVNDEQRKQIDGLQKEHQEKSKANWARMNKARGELSRLQDAGAPMKEIDAAIQEVADAQAEQLRIFARNRREMENILGKEKYDKFMEAARAQFRRHGRRPGPDLPPRPGQNNAPNPPPPPNGSDREEAPPTPVD